MSGPPPFRVEASATRAWRRLIGTFALVSATVLAVWSSQVDSGLACGLAWLAAFALAVAGALAWRPVPAPVLEWDGTDWRLHAGGARDDCRAVSLGVALDLGAWMLLESVESASGIWRRRRRWLSVARGQDRAGWHLLRCAVYFSRPHPGAASAPEIPPPE